MQSYLLDCKIVYNAVILQLQLMHMTILIVVVVIKLHPPTHPPRTPPVYLLLAARHVGLCTVFSQHRI